MLLNNCLVNKKPKEILNIPEDVWKWKHNELKFMRCNRSGTSREFYAKTVLLGGGGEGKKKKKSLNTLTLCLTELERE